MKKNIQVPAEEYERLQEMGRELAHKNEVIDRAIDYMNALEEEKESIRDDLKEITSANWFSRLFRLSDIWNKY